MRGGSEAAAPVGWLGYDLEPGLHWLAHMRLRSTIVGACGALALLAAPLVPAMAGGQPVHLELRVERGRFSAHVVRASLAAVLAEFARLSGASVGGLAEEEKAEVTTSFSNVTVGEGLDRLLRGRSYLLVHEGNGGTARLRRLVILDGQGAHARIASTPAGEAPAWVPGEPDGDGIDPAVTAALEDDDPTVRRRVLEAARELPADDPRRAIVLGRLRTDPDHDVRLATLDAE